MYRRQRSPLPSLAPSVAAQFGSSLVSSWPWWPLDTVNRTQTVTDINVPSLQDVDLLFRFLCTIQWAYRRCQQHMCLRSYRSRDSIPSCCDVNCRSSMPLTMNRKKPTELDLSYSKLRQCPVRVGFTGAQLTILNLSHNSICYIPEELCCLTGLREIYLQHNHLTNIPMSLGSLAELTDLNLDHNELTSLPESIGDLIKLQSLSLSDNRLKSLPTRCCRLGNLEIFKASCNHLTELPDGMFKVLTKLRVLMLSTNRLRCLPVNVGQLVRLEVLDVSLCRLSYLPHTLCSCPALACLQLSHNRLRELPSRMGALHCLQELHIDDNRLSCLPASLVCVNLKSLTVHANPLLSQTSDQHMTVSSTGGVPSLLELTASNIMQNKVPWRKHNIPLSLKEFLENIRWCEDKCCGRYFFEYSRRRLQFVNIADHQMVPVCQEICRSSIERNCMFIESLS